MSPAATLDERDPVNLTVAIDSSPLMTAVAELKDLLTRIADVPPSLVVEVDRLLGGADVLGHMVGESNERDRDLSLRVEPSPALTALIARLRQQLPVEEGSHGA